MVKPFTIFLILYLPFTQGMAQEFFQLRAVLPSDISRQIDWQYLEEGQGLVSIQTDRGNTLVHGHYSKGQTNTNCTNRELLFDLETSKGYKVNSNGYVFLPLITAENATPSKLTVVHKGKAVGNLPIHNPIRVLSKPPREIANRQLIEQNGEEYLALKGEVVRFSGEYSAKCW